MPLKHQVFGFNRVHVLQFVSQARAARGLDAQAHAHALAAFGKVAVDVPGSSFS